MSLLHNIFGQVYKLIFLQYIFVKLEHNRMSEYR